MTCAFHGGTTCGGNHLLITRTFGGRTAAQSQEIDGPRKRSRLEASGSPDGPRIARRRAIHEASAGAAERRRETRQEPSSDCFERRDRRATTSKDGDAGPAFRPSSLLRVALAPRLAPQLRQPPVAPAAHAVRLIAQRVLLVEVLVV